MTMSQAKLRDDQRLVVMSEEVFRLLARPGEEITVSWGEPNAEGWYFPTLYRKPAPLLRRLRTALRGS